MSADTVRVARRQRLLDGYLTVEAADVAWAQFKGGMGAPHHLTRVERRDAAAVLLRDRAAASVLLIEQFRWPTWEKDGGWMLETVAGVIEEGEAPEFAAIRETREETGIEPGPLTPIACFYPTPGYSTERCHLFVADCAGPAQDATNPDAGEDIRLHSLRMADIADLLESGRLQDAKTIMALQWLLLRGDMSPAHSSG